MKYTIPLLLTLLILIEIGNTKAVTSTSMSQTGDNLSLLNYLKANLYKLPSESDSILNQNSGEKNGIIKSSNDLPASEKIKAIHSEAKTVRLNPIRLITADVKINLDNASLEYANEVYLGDSNIVTVRTNPHIIGATIHMSVTDTCVKNVNNDCVRLSPNEPNYLTNPIRKQLVDNGDGTYTGTYKITESSEGYITISFYVMISGLRRLCFSNEDFSGPPFYTEMTFTTHFNWGLDDVCPEYKDNVSSRWEGKLTITESRIYEFCLKVDDFGEFFIDGNKIISADYYSSPIYKNKSLSVGKYDITLTFSEKTVGALYELDWFNPATSSYEAIPLSAFSYTFSMHASPDIKVTCKEGYYIVTGTGNCAECPKGTYNDKTGQFFCELCPEGTYNYKTGQPSKADCLDCTLMTYGDRPGLSRCKDCPAKTYSDELGKTSCSSCHPLCSKCYGPYETQCYSCEESSGAIFTEFDTCKCPMHNYYDTSNNLCTACHALCLSCFSGSSEECQDCNTTISYSIIDKPYICITECEDGYYKDSSTCKCIISSL